MYRKLLAGVRVEIPQDDPRSESVYHLFVVWVEDRDRVRAEMDKRCVGTAIHYPVPLHLQKAYADLGHARGSFPHTERASDQVFSMPLFPEMTNEQAEHAAKALIEIVGRK